MLTILLNRINFSHDPKSLKCFVDQAILPHLTKRSGYEMTVKTFSLDWMGEADPSANPITTVANARLVFSIL